MPPKLLRDALDVVLTWGPERMTPEVERLREKHPGTADEDLHEALQVAHQVMSHAERLAPDVKSNSVNGERQLAEEYPWITRSQASRAIQQGMYFHWKDSGL